MGDEGVEYRDVEDFPGFRVGDDGSVWSCWERYWEKGHRGCRSRMVSEWHKLTPATDEYGYSVVTLRNETTQKLGKVHVMVAIAFKGPKPAKGMQAAHYPKADKKNNAASNIVWATSQENSDHKYEHGTILFGENAPNATLNEDQAIRLLADREAGATLEELGEEYGISTSQAGNICSGLSWPHLKRG